MTYRKAGLGDVPSLVELRLEFMRIVKDEGLPDEAAWRDELSELFARELDEGSLICWLCIDGEVVAGASGIAFGPVRGDGRPARGEAPCLRCDSAAEGLILNMYTLPAYRRRGIASELLRRSIEEGRSRSLRRLRLQPTPASRSLYRRYGFRAAGRDMVLELG